MTTFKEFLLEDEQTLISFLNENCQPLIKEVGDIKKYLKNPLLRGSRTLSQKEKISLNNKHVFINGFIGTTRIDRKPKDTFAFITKFVDDTLEDKFGWKPRTQGLFVSSEYETVRDYGRVFAIFPIGEFEFLYSPKIKDLTINLSKKLKTANPLWKSYSSYGGISMPPEEDYPDMLKEVNKAIKYFTNKDLNMAIELQSEISIKCSKYLAITLDDLKRLND